MGANPGLVYYLLYCEIEVSEIELQSRQYLYIRKSTNHLNPTLSYGLNSTPTNQQG